MRPNGSQIFSGSPTDMSASITAPETEWRMIPGYEKYYASAKGEISLKGERKPMKLTNYHGYLVATMSFNGKPVRVRAHRLVALAWLGECPGKGYEVNHKNLITTDNRVENLEWVNAKDNMRHFFDELKKHGKKLEPQRIGAYNPATGEFQQWPSMTQASKFFGIKDTTMCGYAIDYHNSDKLYKGWKLWKLDENWEVCDTPYPSKKLMCQPQNTSV